MHFFFLFKSREIDEPKSLTFLNCFFFFSNQLGLSDVRIILFQVGKTLKIVLEEEKMCFFYIDLLTLIKITYPKHTCIYEVVRKSKGGGNCGCEAQLMKTAIPKAFSNGSFPCARACRSTWSSGGPSSWSTSTSSRQFSGTSLALRLPRRRGEETAGGSFS